MMKKLVVTLCCVAGLAALPCPDAGAQGRKRVPRFADYPVKEVHTGKSASPLLETEDQRSSSIYYQAIADGGANFAGQYAVIPLTCGKTCTAAEFLDTRTGKIMAGEFSNSGWQDHHDAFRDIEFRKDSRLIVFAGAINQAGPVGWHFYVFDKGKFRRLRTIVTDGDFRKPLSHFMK
jgi:hypothetical protein